MRKFILILAAGAVSLSIPSFAEARSGCQARAHDRRVAGTVIGGIGGAVLGNAVSHRGGGALIGGLGGAVIGNQLSRRSCDRAGYYYRHHHRTRYSSSGYYTRRSNCSVRDASYYNDRGVLVTRQVQTCR
jgi:uncharacterized protein YcfJ